MGLATSFYKLKKAWSYLWHYGPKEFFVRVGERLEKAPVSYSEWLEWNRISMEELERQRQEDPADGPMFSVLVPAYETDPAQLREMIASVLDQTYPKLELCIADASKSDRVKTVVKEMSQSDARIRYEMLDANGGISANTNCAAKLAEGDYLVFLDHDDTIAPEALYEMAASIRTEGADLLYSDEDKTDADGKTFFQPHFKPDFNPDLLRSNNYITHLLVIRRELFEELNGFDPAYDGAQDYDLILRASEKAEKICHIPKILYHWRVHSGSTSDNPMSKQYAYDAGRRAIEAQLARMGEEGTVEELPDHGFYRVHYPVKGRPLVSVIIPNKDAPELLRTAVASLKAADYQETEILIVENNSTGSAIRELYAELSKDPKIRILTHEGSFNYAAINNLAAREAKGDFLLFLNNDVRGTVSKDWLSEMLSVCQRQGVGAVGARLYYPDDTYQHAGCVVGLGGIAGALFVGMKRCRSGYLHKAALLQDLSAVTAACMMMKRSVFEEVGGFTEELAVAFNDIDLCLKAGRAGYRIVYDPYAELIHDESKTRGPEDSVEKLKRFDKEIAWMKEHWSDILTKGDPNYNPNLTLKRWDYSLRGRGE